MLATFDQIIEVVKRRSASNFQILVEAFADKQAHAKRPTLCSPTDPRVLHFCADRLVVCQFRVKTCDVSVRMERFHFILGISWNIISLIAPLPHLMSRL